jgi:hypothetical protein
VSKESGELSVDRLSIHFGNRLLLRLPRNSDKSRARETVGLAGKREEIRISERNITGQSIEKENMKTNGMHVPSVRGSV